MTPSFCRKYLSWYIKIPVVAISSYFSLKCHTPIPLMANVVYQFTCLRDANSTYIGKTIRHLATRVKEHATSSSAINEHLSSFTTCKDNYSCNSFKVIDSANSDFEVSIKEALLLRHILSSCIDCRRRQYM